MGNKVFDINKIIKEHHQAMIDKGFHDCQKCEGTSDYASGSMGSCGNCDGSGVDPNKNIGELLMLIVSELGEAFEAHRKGRFTPKELMSPSDGSKWSIFDKEISINDFERLIKDTFEDEVADVFLRLFDLCGYLCLSGVTLEQIINDHKIKWYSENIGDQLYRITQIICKIRWFFKQEIRYYMIANTIAHLWDFCKMHSIPIEKHILAKMEYNKTRPIRHGKRY